MQAIFRHTEFNGGSVRRVQNNKNSSNRLVKPRLKYFKRKINRKWTEIGMEWKELDFKPTVTASIIFLFMR